MKKRKNVKRLCDEKLLSKLNKAKWYLGEQYHLCITCELNNTSWVLYYHYKNPEFYFSKDNKAIMRSEENSIEDLMNFAKLHRRYNIYDIYKSIVNIAMWVVAIMCFLNIFIINNRTVRNYIDVFILTTDACLIIPALVLQYFDSKNHEVSMREIVEQLNTLERDLEESEEEVKNNE